MNKRKVIIILSVVMMIAITMLLASCSNTIVDLDDYVGTDNGASRLNLIGKLVQWMHGWVKNYGLTVILFTVFLKVVMLPVDIWQRVSMRKNSLKMQAMQPMMEVLEKRYANNPQKLNQEKSKLAKKQSATMLGTCLPFIVTMVIFFLLLDGLTNYATYNTVINYNDMQTFYISEYNRALEDDNVYLAAYNAALEEGKTEEQAKAAANSACVRVASEGNAELGYIGIGQYYVDNIKESFLWIDNVWQPDTWANVMPTYDEFVRTVKLSGENPEGTYNLIREQVVKTHARNTSGSWNGLMILPILSVGLSFLSMFINQRLENKNRKGEKAEISTQQATTNKMMLVVMPLMMAVFGFMYTGAFAIYMVVSYALSLLITISIKKPVEKMVEKSLQKAEAKDKTPKVNYKR